MKILLSYICVMSVGLIFLCFSAKGQKREDIVISHFAPLPLGKEDFSEVPEVFITPVAVTPHSTQSYTPSIDPALTPNLTIKNFKTNNQPLAFRVLKNLYTGKSIKTIHFSVKETDSRAVQLCTSGLGLTTGHNPFSPNAKALTKLPYETKGNWGVSLPSGS